MNYHNLRRIAMYGFLTGAALVSLGCAQTRDRIRSIKNPLINDTVALDKYLLKTGESGAPKIVSASGGSLTEPEGQTVEAEPGKVYELKKGPIIITSKKTKPRQPVITELSATADINANFSELRGLARLLIELAKDWRINPSISGRWATKKYDTGRDLEVQGTDARLTIGKYIRGLESILGPNSSAYIEAGIAGEVSKYLNRTERIDSNVLFLLGLGLFSPEYGTDISSLIGAGAGRYNISDPTVQKDDQYDRIMADLQVKQKIFKGLYGKARGNLSKRDYNTWADSTFLALNAGIGLEEKDLLGMPRAFAEILATYRNELHEYLRNGTTRQEDISGFIIKLGAQLNNNLVLEAGAKWDKEIDWGAFLQAVIRY